MTRTPNAFCEAVVLDLPDLAAGRLAEERAAEVRAHLDGCAACRAVREEGERMTEALRADPTRGTGADPGELFFAGLARKTVEAARRQPVSPARRRWLPAVLMGAASLAAAFLLISFASRGTRSRNAGSGDRVGQGVILAEGPGAGAGAGAGPKPGPAPGAAAATEDDVSALLGDGAEDDSEDTAGGATDSATGTSPLPAIEDLSPAQVEQADENLDDLITQLRSEQRSPG